MHNTVQCNCALLLFFLLLRNNATTVKTSATAKATAMMTIIASVALNPGLIKPPPVLIAPVNHKK